MPLKNDKYDLLVQYLKGTLSQDRRDEFERILESDPELKKTAGFVFELLDESRQVEWDKLKSPAFSTFDRLLRDFKLSEKNQDEKRGIVFYDSKYMPLPEGVRPATVDTRRVKYRIDDATLEISLYPISPGSYELIGQLSGRTTGELLEIEIKNAKTSKRITSNQFQLFRVDRLPAGKYNLKIFIDKRVIAQIEIEL